MRDKLFDIIDGVQNYCSSESTYCCDCDYNRYKGELCWKYKIADAIISSGLLKDEKVYKPIVEEDPFTHANNYWCSACEGYIGTGASGATSRYCPKCGRKIKE